MSGSRVPLVFIAVAALAFLAVCTSLYISESDADDGVTFVGEYWTYTYDGIDHTYSYLNTGTAVQNDPSLIKMTIDDCQCWISSDTDGTVIRINSPTVEIMTGKITFSGVMIVFTHMQGAESPCHFTSKSDTVTLSFSQSDSVTTLHSGTVSTYGAMILSTDSYGVQNHYGSRIIADDSFEQMAYVGISQHSTATDHFLEIVKYSVRAKPDSTFYIGDSCVYIPPDEFDAVLFYKEYQDGGDDPIYGISVRGNCFIPEGSEVLVKDDPVDGDPGVVLMNGYEEQLKLINSSTVQMKAGINIYLRPELELYGCNYFNVRVYASGDLEPSPETDELGEILEDNYVIVTNLVCYTDFRDFRETQYQALDTIQGYLFGEHSSIASQYYRAVSSRGFDLCDRYGSIAAVNNLLEEFMNIVDPPTQTVVPAGTTVTIRDIQFKAISANATVYHGLSESDQIHVYVSTGASVEINGKECANADDTNQLDLIVNNGGNVYLNSGKVRIGAGVVMTDSNGDPMGITVTSGTATFSKNS